MVTPQRGDIFQIDVLQGEIQGHELFGPHAWVVLSIGPINERLHLFTAVPLTSIVNKNTGKAKDEGAFRYFRPRILASHKTPEPGQNHHDYLTKDGLALPEQIRVFSTQRITRPKIGTLTPVGLGVIDVALAFVQGKGFIRQVPESDATPTETVTAQAAPRAYATEPARPLPGTPFRKK